MNFFKFTFFTLIGAGIWSLFLILFGYFLGANFSLYSNYLNLISYLIGGIFIILFFIILFRKRKLRF
jgi:membrane protein DedA with SNARE-associated domain